MSTSTQGVFGLTRGVPRDLPFMSHCRRQPMSSPMTTEKSLPLKAASDGDAETGVTPEGYEAPTPGGWEDYPLDQLAIRDERRTAEDVVRRMEKKRFVLDPDFQRDFLWDDRKQSRLIESVLMRIPLPVFYVAEDDQGRLVVVDGRQRLTTLKRFMEGELKLTLPDRPELHGKVFGKLETRLQNRVEDCQLHFYIIDHDVPERARLDIFERVNGGEVLTRQQMRNAIYNGPATRFLKAEATTPLFVKATGGSLNAKRMLDREFVNRFCAFDLLDIDSYRGDMDDWLARGLKCLAELSDVERARVAKRLDRGLRNNLLVFGKHAFRKHRSRTQTRSLINASLFDVMMAGLSRRTESEVSENAEALREAFFERMADERFIKAITYGPNSTREVRARFRIAKLMMSEVFDA